MRVNLLLFVSVMLTALAASLFAATEAVDVIEARSAAAVESALAERDIGWASADIDGLKVILSGTAPDEAARFAAIRAVGTVVDAARVVDRMEVAAASVIAPPRFSVEILRNGDGISVIGLLPAEADRDRLLREIERMADGAVVTDLMETADFPAPDSWDAATRFGLSALARLPRSKISIAPGRVAIVAMARDQPARQALTATLTAEVPAGIALDLDISAPRPVITPFTLRLVLDAAGARFDACTAGSAEGLATILAAAREIGIDDADCPIGLGAPSPDWPAAVVAGVTALGRLGEGTLTFSDTDVSLVGTGHLAREAFEREVGSLEAALPAGFSLTAVLPRPEGAEAGDGPPNFTATRSPEGLVQLRGRVGDATAKAALASFAIARFGTDAVADGTRIGSGLPEGWAPRTIAALDALTLLHNGSVVVDPDRVTVRGQTGLQQARAEIARRLSAMLGEGADFDIAVSYERRYDPSLNLPTAETCVARINAALDASQITFAPGSDRIEDSAAKTLDAVAGILRECRDVEMTLEIGGHTDSQGRESMNLKLSQERAEAVLNALRDRRAPTARISARGYGEAFPIADNGTPEGREANRRIEMRLIAETGDAGTADEALPAAPAEAAPAGTAPAEAAHDREHAAAAGEGNGSGADTGGGNGNGNGNGDGGGNGDGDVLVGGGAEGETHEQN